MTFPRVRLVVSALLLVGWLGFLGYLVIISRDLIVVSRPQLAVAEAVWRVEIEADEEGVPLPNVRVEEIIWSNDPKEDAQRVGQKARFVNLADATADQGFRGPGQYYLPIWRKAAKELNVLLVPPIPTTPGFAVSFYSVHVSDVGKSPEPLVHALKESLGWSEEAAKAKVERISAAQGIAILSRSMPAAKVGKLFQVLEKTDVRLHTRTNDIRIYPAVSDTTRQLDRILKEMGRSRP